MIADGVSINFDSHQRLPSLRPPTVPRGPDCPNVKTIPVSLLTDSTLRTALNSTLDKLQIEDWTTVDELAQRFQDSIETDKRKEVTDSLATLLRTLHSLIIADPPVLSRFRSFLRQLATRDNFLLILRPSASLTASLSRLLTNTRHNDWLPIDEAQKIAVTYPDFGELVLYYSHAKKPLPWELVSLLVNLNDISSSIFRTLCEQRELERVHARQEEEDETSTDFRKTGLFYGPPEIRKRRAYPLMKENIARGSAGQAWTADEKARQREEEKAAAEGERTCRKFYGTYQRQTGGLMILWCQHSISYGFHVIPRGEGRNDVFSAIYTRWPTAPKHILYDFACALGGYALLREPGYFKDTLFLTDRFHAAGHTACSSSTFVDRYTSHIPELEKVNDSAAECGNAVLGRIRKSVSYMTQKRAVAFSHHFLSVWNRCQILKIK